MEMTPFAPPAPAAATVPDAPLADAPPRADGVSAPALVALLDFVPVPVGLRADGWTPEKQRGFIEALADSGSVPAAAKSVGMGWRAPIACAAAPMPPPSRRHGTRPMA